MHIRLERSGGFAGIPWTTEFDTESLTEEEALTLESLVKEAAFFDLPEKAFTSRTGADQFQYRLIVESGGKKHAVEFGESNAPEPLRRLQRKLVELARSSGSSPGASTENTV